MKTTLQIIVFLSFLLAVDCLYAMEWRGIVPFRSTRQDVEKVLGTLARPSRDKSLAYSSEGSGSQYFLYEGEIYIRYASKLSWQEGIKKCLNKMAEDTVLDIEVKPWKKVLLRSLDFDLRNAEVFDPSTPQNIGYKAYYEKKQGVIISTYEREVYTIVYIATSKDKRLCPDIYQDPKDLVKVFIHTDILNQN